jgi:TusA-related sulfurtransferase
MAMSEHRLDLRGVACPLNFVKTKLILDKLERGSVLEVLLDEGEPIESVASSVQAEGHQITNKVKSEDGYYCLVIRKV